MSVSTSGVNLYDLAGLDTGAFSALSVSGGVLYLSGAAVATLAQVQTTSGNANGFYNILTGMSGQAITDYVAKTGLLAGVTTSGVTLKDRANNSSSPLLVSGGPLYMQGNSAIGYAGAGGSGGGSYAAFASVTLVARQVPLLNAGTPADIAVLYVPSGITRWRIPTAGGLSSVMVETQTGAFGFGASNVFSGWEAPSQGGLQVLASIGLSATGGQFAPWNGVLATIAPSTSNAIYIRQGLSAVGTGTCSFYVTIYPIP